MQDHHVPAIGRYYWPTLAAATLFGTNAGDLLVTWLGAHGLKDLYLPALALVFAAILYTEARDTEANVRWYWLAVIIAPTASNHLADLSFAHLGVRRLWVCAGLVTLLVVAHLAFQSDTTRIIALRLQQRPQPTVPVTDATYWIAMVVASTAGTLASDFLTAGQHLGLAAASLVLAVPVLVIGGLRRWTDLNRTWTYWSAVVALNALATAAGELLASDPRLGIGLGRSVMACGLVLAVLLAARRYEPSLQRAR
jgi:uncharacterized membrane-anchored protein